MNTSNPNNNVPLKGTPEYRRRYWRLVAVQIVAWVVLMIGLLFGMLGKELVADLGWTAVGTCLIVAIVTQFQLHALVEKGRGPAKQ